MNIQEIKEAINNGLIVACNDSQHIVMLDSHELWGLAVMDTKIHKSTELTRCAMDDCFILEGM